VAVDDDLDPDGLYHLATPADWAEHRARGRIAPPSLSEEGFVHCSWGRQVPSTVAKHFAGVDELLALRLDPAAVEVVEEDSYGSGQAFPHVYDSIPISAVIVTVPVRPG